ncbi:MAG: PAS domain-containing protein, partial [Candidatus Binatia bacterium]
MKRQKKPVHKDLQDLYQEAPIGLCSLDTNLRYLHINDWLAKLNGLPVEAHLGRTIREVLPDVAAGVEQQLRKVMETGEPIIDGRVDAETPAHPGVIRNFLHHYHPNRSEDGRIVGVSCVVEDITKRKRAEEALRQAHDELESRVTERTKSLVTANAQLEVEITERKKAEELLRKTNKHFRLLLETTSALPWEADARTWRFTYVGPQAVKLLNYPVQQWYEKDFWATHLHPEDRQRAIDICESSSRKLAEYEFEYRMVSADGRVVWFHDLVSVVSVDGVPTLLRGFMLDITERKQSEEAIRASEERYRTLVDSSPYCIHEIDLMGQLISMNPAGLSVMGVTHESKVIGRPYLTAVSEEDQERVGKLLALACKGETADFTFRGVNGRHFQTYFVPIDDDKGAIVKLMSLTQDITEEKLAKEALRYLSGHVINAQEEERGHIARELHDDIGQRLALIAIDIQLLIQADHQPKAEFGEQLENLRSQVETLSSDVHNLSHQLHPAKLEQLGLVTALKSLCREIQDSGEMSIEFSEKNIPKNVSSEISLCLYRIVQEAIRNVVKHSGVTQASVELTGAPHRICLRVCDSGVGFNAEMVNEKKEGLGIVSMKERVRLVGGDITIQS